MARNQEKQYGKLNRLILQKEREEWVEKHPPRPKLASLHTVDDIKKWLPSIKRDIEFNLKQSQVTCYSDTKISELQAEIVKLEREYKSFVRKIRQVDSSITSVPWTNRPYERQKAPTEIINGVYEFLDGPTFIPIATPILDSEEQEMHPVEVETSKTVSEASGNIETIESLEKNGDALSTPVSDEVYSLPGEDEPLDFSTSFQTSLISGNEKPESQQNNKQANTNYERHLEAIQSATNKLYGVFGIEERNWSDDEDGSINDLKATNQTNRVDNWSDCDGAPGNNLKVHKRAVQIPSLCCTSPDVRIQQTSNKYSTNTHLLSAESGKGLLNLDYSSSDED